MSSIPAMMRCLSSYFEATRIWRGPERANLEKKPSIRLSQERCLGTDGIELIPGDDFAQLRKQHGVLARGGGYVSYLHADGIENAAFGHIRENAAHFAAECEYYLNRWTLKVWLASKRLASTLTCCLFLFQTASSITRQSGRRGTT